MRFWGGTTTQPAHLKQVQGVWPDTLHPAVNPLLVSWKQLLDSKQNRGMLGRNGTVPESLLLPKMNMVAQEESVTYLG